MRAGLGLLASWRTRMGSAALRERHASTASPALQRPRRTSPPCLALALLALTCATPARGAVIGVRSAPGRAPAAEIAIGRAHARCPRGHVLLALRGPRLIVPRRPLAYVVLARACGYALGRVHVSVLQADVRSGFARQQLAHCLRA